MIQNCIILDYSICKKYFKTIYYCLLAPLFFSLMGRNEIYCIIFCGILLSIRTIPLPFEVLNGENQSNLYAMLPVKSLSIVIGRYIFVFLTSAWYLILSSVVIYFVELYRRNNGIMNIFWGLILGVCFVIILIDIQIPMIYSRGVIRGKNSGTLFTTGTAAMILLLFFHFGFKSLITLIYYRFFIILLIAVICLLTVWSIKYSHNIIKKKGFNI